jgi:hypothetical protein
MVMVRFSGAEDTLNSNPVQGRVLLRAPFCSQIALEIGYAWPPKGKNFPGNMPARLCMSLALSAINFRRSRQQDICTERWFVGVHFDGQSCGRIWAMWLDDSVRLSP